MAIQVATQLLCKIVLCHVGRWCDVREGTRKEGSERRAETKKRSAHAHVWSQTKGIEVVDKLQKSAQLAWNSVQPS